ncbi:MAG: hypothetical protein K0V04_16705 [Deltaproteobacteria bacterium]|nr:hypothetical protein [Deltaproteobacteria bacterium]
MYPPISRFVRRATKLSMLGAAALYCLLLVLYNMPYNPLVAVLKPGLDATIGSYASQNWRLFAPTPTTSDVAMVVGCVDAQTAETLAVNAERGEDATFDGPWHDITLPLWKSHQANRLSAYDRLSRPQTNAARDYLQMPADLVPWGKSCKNGDERACRYFEERAARHRVGATHNLRRVASSYCLAAHPDATAVAVRLRETAATPWSARYDREPRVVKDGDLGIFPLDTTIMPAPMYGAGQES